MSFSPTVKKMLTACSASYIDVDAARKVADLKAITMAHLFTYQMDLSVFRDDYGIPLRIYFPDKETMEAFRRGQSKTPIIIYIHGGGWVTDNPANYQRISVKMAKRLNSIIISIDYRLAPEYKFPTGLEDCYYIVSKICQNQFVYPIRTKDITVMGDSAGGNLATAVCMMARDRGEFKVGAQILIYPVTNSDYSETSPYPSVHENGHDYVLTSGKMRDFVKLYEREESDRLNPYFTPLMSEDLSNVATTLVITAQYDPLRDEGEAYGRLLREAGNKVRIHRVSKVIHGFFGVGVNIRKIDEVLDLMERFMKNK